MRTTTIKLVTIIAERVLQERLINDIMALGARGYTLGDVSGAGTHGIRQVEFVEGRNVRLETLVRPDVAQHILEYLAEVYFPDYAIVAYATDATVVRGEKYG